MTDTPQEAAEALQSQIIKVGMGRVRLGLSPDETDEYIQEQYRKLRELKNVSARHS